MRTRTLASLAAGAGLALVLATPLAASAHVSLTDDTAEPGGSVLLTFKVPTESATAVTTGITITLPDGITSARAVPLAGWTATVSDGTIGYVANGTGIAEHELGLFTVSVGPVPEVDSLAFPVVQAYSDGSVVAWSDTAEGAEHPAPVLYVNAAPPADDHHSDASVTAEQPGPDVLARVVGILGVVVGAVGITLAVLARRRERT